jgi:hypothetical protein
MSTLTILSPISSSSTKFASGCRLSILLLSSTLLVRCRFSRHQRSVPEPSCALTPPTPPMLSVLVLATTIIEASSVPYSASELLLIKPRSRNPSGTPRKLWRRLQQLRISAAELQPTSWLHHASLGGSEPALRPAAGVWWFPCAVHRLSECHCKRQPHELQCLLSSYHLRWSRLRIVFQWPCVPYRCLFSCLRRRPVVQHDCRSRLRPSKPYVILQYAHLLRHCGCSKCRCGWWLWQRKWQWHYRYIRCSICCL